MLGEDIASVAHSRLEVGIVFGTEERPPRAELRIVPDLANVDLGDFCQIAKIVTRTIDYAAGRDLAIRIDGHRAIQIETRTGLIRLAERLLLVGARRASGDVYWVPFFG